jgi:prepilin-type N-terminal cleavage/methylation domain-containing protein
MNWNWTLTKRKTPRKACKGKASGFSLIELLIVVAIILIIAAIAIPNLLRAKIAANESSAVSSLRTITTAETTYSSTWGAGYAAAIDNLGGPTPCVIASAANACIIEPLLSVAPYTKSGYSFVAVGNTPVGGVNNGFEANATPTTADVTGKRAFCSDQTGVLRSNTTGVAIGTAPGTCATVATLIIGN